MGSRESTVERQPPLHRQLSYDHFIRLCVAGCAANIQTDALIDEFLGYGYREGTMTCIPWDFKIHRITVYEDRIKLQLWNVYGVRYYGLSPALFRGTLVGLILLYDVGEERSFERAKELISDAQQINPKTSILLVGCHYKQVEEERQVTYYTAREFADNRDISVIEIICGEEGVNVELAFMILLGSVLSRNKIEK